MAEYWLFSNVIPPAGLLGIQPCMLFDILLHVFLPVSPLSLEAVVLRA